jgi:hypothetical protein
MTATHNAREMQLERRDKSCFAIGCGVVTRLALGPYTTKAGAHAFTKQPDHFIDLAGFDSQAVQRL